MGKCRYYLWFLMCSVCFGTLGDITLDNAGNKITWKNNSQTFSIAASSSMSESVAYSWPVADATAGGQALLSDGAGILSFGVPTTSASHNILSTIHDATTSAVTKGDLIFGDTAGTAWDDLAIGTANQVLRVDSGLPDWETTTFITALGTITTGAWNADVIAVTYGGTGASSLTDGGILLGSGTGAVTALGVASNGQIPIGDGATDPVLATLTEGLAIDITNGAGSITVIFDPTELLGNQTWGDASTDTIVWTWNRATGTDPTITFGNDFISLNGDLKILGDDLFMTTNTDRFVLIGDGTNYNPEALDLGTDTTGDYVASVATTSPLSGGSAGSEAAALTLTIADADDDGVTKGAASFDNTDFNAVAGNVTIVDDGHAHTGSSISGIDISSDTNLAVTAPIVLTDDTVSITVAKDIVAGVGLSGGEDNVLPGADADTTLTFDATELDAITWSDGSNASNVWTFDVSGTNHTMTAGSALMTFSQALTATGTITGGTLTDGTATITGGVGTFGEIIVDTLNFNGRAITNSSGFLNITSTAGINLVFAPGPASLTLSAGELLLTGDLGADASSGTAGVGTPFNMTLRKGGDGTAGTATGGKGGTGTFTAGDGGDTVGGNAGSGGGWDYVCGARGVGGSANDGKFTVTVVGNGTIDFTGPLNVSGLVTASGNLQVDGTSLFNGDVSVSSSDLTLTAGQITVLDSSGAAAGFTGMIKSISDTTHETLHDAGILSQFSSDLAGAEQVSAAVIFQNISAGSFGAANRIEAGLFGFTQTAMDTDANWAFGAPVKVVGLFFEARNTTSITGNSGTAPVFNILGTEVTCDVGATGETIAGSWWPYVGYGSKINLVAKGTLNTANLSLAATNVGDLYVQQLNWTDNMSVTAGSFNVHGLFIDDITAIGSGTAYAIRTGTGLHEFGDDINMTGNVITDVGGLHFNSATELTISGGAVTVTQGHHSIDTEANAANDDLDTINGGNAGEILLILPKDDNRTVRIRHAIGNIFLKHQVESKSYSFSSPAGSSGTFYSAGYYNWASADGNLTQASLSVTHSATNSPSACHIGIVAGGAGVVDTGVVKLIVTGTTIDDDGNRLASQTVILVADITTLDVNDYTETIEKWIGQVTIALATASGSPVNFNLDINYGCSKYEDFGNQEFTINVLEVVGRAGANDSGFNLRLFHHSSAGWTFAATGFVPGGTVLANMNTDYSTEQDLANGESFAYKRVNLNTDISGDNAEGLILEVTTGANKAVEVMDMHLTVHTAPNFSYMSTITQHLIFMKHGNNWLEL